MTMLPIRKVRVSRKALPIQWRETGWTIRILVRSALPVLRRLSGLNPVSGSRALASRVPLRGLRGRPNVTGQVRVRPVATALRGRVSNRRRLSCDPATMSRLTAFAALPLCPERATRVRVFRFFLQPQFAL
jgi:hypothetical protein